MKKHVVLVMLLALLLGLTAPALAAEGTDKQPHITVNGVEALCESYTIGGDCYVKLRDLAMMLSGSGCQFDVGWDDATRTVLLNTGRPYTALSGSEMRLGRDRSAAAVKSTQTFLVDGDTRSDLTVYNIEGSNFFSLRQLGDILDFDVTYSTETGTAAVTSISAAEANGDAVILYTSDVHAGIDLGFGYVGLEQIRESLEALGNDVILVDDGDNIQGQLLATMTKGAAMTELMNEMGYSVAVPGNHEFDYGMEQFLSLTEKAEFDYISCNFNRGGAPVFAPYVLRELGGHSVAFVGVSTPMTLRTSSPRTFLNEDGSYAYGFFQDNTGEGVCESVQAAVDAARAEGAEVVIALAHLGNSEESRPWTYADVISHTSGIDVLLDGHSHDTEQVVMKNAQGKTVIRSACGTNLQCVGWCRIGADGRISAGLYSWEGETAAPEALGLENRMSAPVAEALGGLSETLKQVVGTTEAELTIHDPAGTEVGGWPLRIVRLAETNLGDLCADAFRDQAGADIGFINGGGVRASIAAGDITYSDLCSVMPYGNYLCVIEVSGRQLLDALEWAARAVPGESGAFMQVSGMSYEIHSYIESPCITDENGMFGGIEGERRIKNVSVGGLPIDPDGTYTLASCDFMLLQAGDGFSMFRGATVLQESVKLDNQALIDYITGTLGGTVGEAYADPYGQGRIVIVEEAP